MAHLTNRQGASIADVNPAAIDAALGELGGPEDDEHPDVAISDEHGWTLSAFPSGLLIWENVEGEGQPVHLRDVPRSQMRRLFLAVLHGDSEVVTAEP